jgi:hypothetical protein
MTFGPSAEQLFGLAMFASYLLFIQNILERNRVSGTVSLTHIGLTLSPFGYTWYCELFNHPIMRVRRGRIDIVFFMWWSFVEFGVRQAVALRQR